MDAQERINAHYRELMKEGTLTYGSEMSRDERYRSGLWNLPIVVGATILEVGVGCGDFVEHLRAQGLLDQRRTFLGVDVTQEQIRRCKVRFGDIASKVSFVSDAFLDMDVRADYVFAFSVFDQKLGSQDETHSFAMRMLERMYEVSRVGVYCTFLSAHKTVDNPDEALFYPDDVLRYVRRFTERYIIDCSFMPHAFGVTLLRQKSPWRVWLESEETE